ncbi:hypothetical protein ACQ4PT_009996 [Festuca glaucescens]
MRDIWKLPHEQALCLNQVDDSTKASVLLLFWRAWHLRNNIVHQQGRETIASSICFLQSYTSTHLLLPVADEDVKGKAPLLVVSAPSEMSAPRTTKGNWTRPPADWIKLNTNASFIGQGNPSAAGAVARDHEGNAILAACSPLPSYKDAEEAKLNAAL